MIDDAHPPKPRVDRRRFGRGVLALPSLLLACTSVERASGGVPGAPFHHTPDGFRNPEGSPTPGGGVDDWAGFFWRNLNRRSEVPLPPGHVLPEDEALAGFRALGDRDGVTWLGHAAFLVRLGGRTILTDPYLSEYASPLARAGLGPRRFAPPGIRVGRLPPADVLLLSHNHYDHLDRITLEALPNRERVTAVVPLGVDRYVGDLGFGSVRTLDWHGSTETGGVRVTALPAVHFSKRGLFDRNRTLWAGFALEAGGKRVYFAGDTAFGPVFQRVGPDHGPFDLGLIPIGAYEPRPLMVASHATPEEAVAIGRSFGARRLIGMHWGTIQLTDEPPFAPPGRFRDAARAAGYDGDAAEVLAVGGTRAL